MPVWLASDLEVVRRKLGVTVARLGCERAVLRALDEEHRGLCLTIGASGLPGALKRQAGATLRLNEIALTGQRTRVQACSSELDELQRTIRELEGDWSANTRQAKASRDAMRELLVIVQRDLKQRALRRLAAEAENCETKPPARPGEGAH